MIGVSLGDEALFRIGSPTRGGKTAGVALASGDVIAFGGVARLAYHGIDRIRPGTSRLVPAGTAEPDAAPCRPVKKSPRPGGRGQNALYTREEHREGMNRGPSEERGLKASGGQCQQPRGRSSRI